MKKIWFIIKWVAGLVRPFFGSILLIIIFSAVRSLCGVGMAVASKELIDAAIKTKWNTAIFAGAFFVGGILLQISSEAISSLLRARTSEIMQGRLRHKLYQHLSRAKWSEVSKFHSGDILTRMTSDIGIVVDGAVDDLPEMISLGIGLLASFLVLLFFDPLFAVIALFMGPAIVLMSRIFGSRFVMIHMKAQESEGKFRSFLQECIEHMLVLKAFRHEKQSGEHMKELQEDRIWWSLKRNKTNVLTRGLLSGGYWSSYILAFGWGIFRLSRKAITFGTFTAFLQLVELVQQPFMGLAETLPGIFSVAASSERLIALESLNTEELKEIDNDCNVQGFSLKEIDFEYKDDIPVLRDITVNIHRGDVIGLIGASGEGKTTLIHLIMSLLEPVKGMIGYHDDNKVFHRADASIRTFISYVPQGNTLFSGTISYNLSIGNPDATLEEQIAALNQADALDFINKLPDGLNTMIGEHGLGLSEGQAQRIAIARALLNKAPILILDEATSALDMQTEQKILKAIGNLNPKRTCIIITHRPSMLNICNRIWRLKNGELHQYLNEVPASEVI